jgi:multicomponent Na+:H+ antiporter subunit B
VVSGGDAVIRAVARLLIAPALMVAAALMVKGYVDVGDGFSAGVVVSLGIALGYVGYGASGIEQALPVLRRAPALMVCGLLLALATGFFPLLWGAQPFSHRPGPGHDVATVGSLELFTPLLFDVGVFLLVVGVLTVLLHQMVGAVDWDDEARS